MERVLIVGCPGAGKSTAARDLAERTGLPIVHLDRHYWRPGWTRPDPEVWRRQVADLVAQPRWIMDGNYGGTLDLRLAAADTLIHLDYPTLLCFWRAARRSLAGLGSHRDGELPHGCPERVDFSFLAYVLRYRRRWRNRDLQRLAAFQGSRRSFARPAELAAFLSRLE